MIRRLTVLLLVSLWAMGQSLPVAAEALKVGVSPNGVNSVALAKRWIPFLDQLEAESGVELRFSTAPDLLEFNQRLAAGEYDLVVTDQYLYTIFRQKHSLAYLAELGSSQESAEMALVTAVGTKDLVQLEGGLLAVKHDEKPANIKSLDKFLTVKGVTALRDNLSSYDKILQSVAEKLHIAGFVPVSKLEPPAQNYHVLWRVTNRHSYVMTTHAGMSDDILKKLTGGLKRLLMDTSDVSNARQVQVLSAVERGEAGQ